MAIQTIKTALARVVLIASLALTVATGSVALAGVPDVAAMPRYTCDQALALSKTYLATGNVFFGLGEYQMASFYYGMAAAYADYC